MTKWLFNMDELMEKYPGQYLALVDNEIVSCGDSEFEAYKKAKEKNPDKKIPDKKQSIKGLPAGSSFATAL